MGGSLSIEECDSKCEQTIKDHHNEEKILNEFKDKYFQKVYKTFTSEDFYKSYRDLVRKSLNGIERRIVFNYASIFNGGKPLSDEEKKIHQERINDLITLRKIKDEEYIINFKKFINKKETKEKLKKDYNQFIDEVVFPKNDDFVKGYTGLFRILREKNRVDRFVHLFVEDLYRNKDNDKFWTEVKEDIKSRTDRFNEENKKDGKLVLNSSTNTTTTSKGEEKVNESSDETSSQSTTETNATSTGTEGFVNIDDSIKFKKILFILIIIVLFLHLFTDFKIF